jgi:drug/metabolite transporter (DMT)-like permease
MSVGGSMLISVALKGRGGAPSQLLEAGLSGKGLAGITLMLLSFIVLTYALSMYTPKTFIPVNTATSFMATILLSYLIGYEAISLTAVAGMLLIGTGITLVLRGQ